MRREHLPAYAKHVDFRKASSTLDALMMMRLDEMSTVATQPPASIGSRPRFKTEGLSADSRVAVKPVRLRLGESGWRQSKDVPEGRLVTRLHAGR